MLRNPLTARAATGINAERAAQSLLRKARYKLLNTNWHCRLGELDIVALAPDGTLAIVEVRARARNDWGGAEASVTPSKQRKLIQATRYYLAQHPQYTDHPMRFDIISFDGRDSRGSWLQDAFQIDF